MCPYCNEIQDISLVRENETINVRGEDIDIASQFLKCSKCNNTFDDPNSSFDALDLAYREYRRKHNMLQPEDIKGWRKQLGLTQIELSRILGFGDVTINRYEGGKLQESSHDKAMRLAMQPSNMLILINENNNCILAYEKKINIINKLNTDIDLANSFESFLNAKLSTYQPNLHSGHNTLNLDKVFAALIFFCNKVAVFKTKLNKLMFYADFKYFKDNGLSITGLQYAKLPYGPAPDNYDLYIATLLKEGKIAKQEYNGGEKFLACQNQDLSIFSEEELKILMYVKDYFKSFNASKISDYSHKEKAYTDTEDSHLIDYSFASELRI